MSEAEAQSANTVMMIRPAQFQSNPMTAESNRFQGRSELREDEQQARALAEFDGLVDALRYVGVNVVVIEDTPVPPKPDSVFPNNWVSFHADGRVVLYPMAAPNRRPERRMDVIEHLHRDLGFHVTELVDLSGHESSGHFLEGTGSMVLDRGNRVAYACLSSRTMLDPLGDFAQRMDYDVVAFDAVDRSGTAIYHTNVLMSLGESLAIICSAALAREEQRNAVLEQLRESGRTIVDLSFDQLEAFAGNMLELRNAAGERVMAMSKRALDALTDEQLIALELNGRLVASKIDNIEAAAGGSVRCMLAEVHLPTL